jgi:hypothetical protein
MMRPQEQRLLAIVWPWRRLAAGTLLSVVVTACCRIACGDDPQFDYALATAGRVSLAIYDAQGRMVRPMCYGEQQAAGHHVRSWDGLDRYGVPQPPGKYQWRLLRTPGFSREFLVNVGVNTPWAPFDIWPGNHFGPSLVMVDEDRDLYVGAISTEGPPHLIKIALDGSKKYWDSGTWGLADGLSGMARMGNVVYLLMVSKGRPALVEVRRADNGNKFYGVPKMRRLAESNLPLADLTQEGGSRGGKNAAPTGFTGGDGFLAVSYRDSDEILFLWPVDDKIERRKTVQVPKPAAMTVGTKGRTFAVSGNDIVEVDPEKGQMRPVVRDVPEPGKLAYDPKFNDLLVVSGGTCVRRYHWPDGKLIAVYGQPEGRSYGLFNPLDFDDLLDIAADRQGGFVTVEQYPRRVAHFRGREKHELVNQWFGGLQWGSQATLDPADPTVTYVPIDPKHLGRGKIDYRKKTWTLTHLYPMVDHASWNVGTERHPDILPVAGQQIFWEVRHNHGQTFLLSRGSPEALGSVVVLRVDEEHNRLLPVAYLGCLHPTVDRQQLPDWWLGALKRLGYKNPKTFEAAGGYKHFAFTWADKNANGRIDISEITLGSVGLRRAAIAYGVGPNWDVVLPVLPEGSTLAFSQLPNDGSAERPEWKWAHERLGKLSIPAAESAQVRPVPSSIHRDDDAAIYMTVNNQQTDADAADVPPLTWPNNVCHSSRLLKWDGHGKEMFSVGIHTDSKGGEPGVFSDLREILGEVHDCLVVMDACSPANVWTRDGLYAGSFRDDVGAPTKPEGWQTLVYGAQRTNGVAAFILDDNHWGQVVQTADGDVMWGQMGVNNTPFYRITGWDGWERQEGEITLRTSAPAAKRQGTGLAAEYFRNSDLSGKPDLRSLDPVIAFGPMHGDHRDMKPLHSWPRETSGSAFSASWTGSIEAPLTEDFTFKIYLYGDEPSKTGSKVRLWIGERLIIDAWDEVSVKPLSTTQWRSTRGLQSEPISLRAGERLPAKIEFASPGSADAHLHLYWGSPSFDLRHVPQAYLYPAQSRNAARQGNAGNR